jgi:hypothetical protein
MMMPGSSHTPRRALALAMPGAHGVQVWFEVLPGVTFTFRSGDYCAAT